MSNSSEHSGQGVSARVARPPPAIPDFELVRIVGRGSYGDVWLARSVTGAWRAIKVVWRERFTNPEPFEREFRGLKEFAEVSLGESSQMALLHVGRNDPSGFFYYVMELADDAENGRMIDPERYVPLTLSELRMRRGRIPADECVRSGTSIARALASLHRRGLVHRDIKPSNVIVVSGVPKLADVGLVAPSASAHTFVGTEGYVPPEGPGTPAADVYALGKMLYELSTGHDRQEFPRLPADLAKFPDRGALLELNEVILHACAPGAAQRYRDGAAMLADLTALSAGVSLRTRRLASLLIRGGAIAALVAAVAVGGSYVVNRLNPPPVPVAAGISPYSVAVMPFANATGDPSQDCLAGGLSDEVLHALEREQDLRVTGSRSVFWFLDHPAPDMDVASRLRVAQLVGGTMRRTGTKIRLEVRVTRGIDGVSDSLGIFERDAGQVFALEEDVARAIAKRILHRVTMPPIKPSTTNMDAYGAFLRGRVMQAQGTRPLKDIAAQFERAVALDPQFAVAWARLAETRNRIAGVAPELSTQRTVIAGVQNDVGVAPDSSRPTVERALAAQPDLALAWAERGFIIGIGQNDSAEGLRDLDRAEERGGSNAETRMFRFLVTWFAGESRGLLPLAREAMAGNPENVERITVVPNALAVLGDYVEADRLYQQAIARFGPEQSGGMFKFRVILRRRWRGAEAALRLAEQAPADQQYALEMRVQMLGATGRTAEAAKLLGKITPTPDQWKMFSDAGLVDSARTLALAELPNARESFEKIDRADHTRTDLILGHWQGALYNLICIEIEIGNRENVLALLETWRTAAQKMTPNRRAASFGAFAPACYASLGRSDEAIDLLRQTPNEGLVLGFELRDTPAYSSLQKDPRFQELRREAEAWAARQPDPPDDPAAKSQQPP